MLSRFNLTLLLSAVSFLYIDAAAAQDNAAEESAPEVEKPVSEKPAKKKPAKKPAEEQEEQTADEQPSKPTETPAKPETPVVVTRSATSLALDERLSVGSGIGWSYVKPKVGKWNGLGTTTVIGSWRKSPKPDGTLFITGSYTPYAGTWLVDERFYNTTAHAFTGGASWLLSSTPGKASIKAGVELGVLMVYASPQDGSEADGQVKGAKFAGGGNFEMNWTFLNKVKAGPFLRLNAGNFSTAFLGGAVHCMF